MVFHDREQRRFVESPSEGGETLRLIPSNREVPDWERIEGVKATVSGEFVWVESKEVEGRGGEKCLKVTVVIFVAPKAWAKVVVPLVLGQGGGLGRLLREAREVREEWISRVRERFAFTAIERERFAGEGELPRACYPLDVKVPSFLFQGTDEGKIVRLLERGRSLGLSFGALWTLIRWEFETYKDGSEVRVEGSVELNPELGEDRVVRSETEFLVEVRRLALWKRRSWTTLASFSVHIRDAGGVRSSRAWRKPLLEAERRFEEDSRYLRTSLTSMTHLVETRFWDRTGDYEEALRQTLREDEETGRARCEDSLVEAATRLAGVRDLIRRCAQEGIRGISDLEIANLALAASEEKKLRDSWWTVTSEESEREGAGEDSREEKGGSEEEEDSEDSTDDSEGDEPEDNADDRVTEAPRGVPVESRWADPMDAEARIGEAQEFPRDRQGYRPLRAEEEECQDRRDLREGRSAETGGRPRRWVERIPEAVTGERQALVGQRIGTEMRMPAREGAVEGSRGLPIESWWADLPDARMGEALEFPRDRVGCRPPRRGEEGGPSKRDLRDERPAEAGSRPRRWAERESDAAWAPREITGRSQGVEAWRGFKGQDHARWETDWPNEESRYGEDPWGPPRPRAQIEEPDPSWYKPYDPAIDGPMEGPYFRRYDDRRVPYYDVNLGLEALFFDGRDVTGFMEKWESYAYRKRFSEREWIDYFIQHSDPELDRAIRAIYPAVGRWRTFGTSLLRTFACDDLIPTVEGLRRITRGERASLVTFTRRFKRLSQALVDRGMLSEVDRCVMFMLHLPEEKRKEVLEKAPRDSANFEKVAKVVFTGGGMDVREYMKETLDMALRNMRGTRNDGPRGNDRPPPGPPGPRWGERPTGWRNESSGQGGWRNGREIGGNRGSDWGNSHWKDARDGRWGDTPQARTSGPWPECTLLEYLAASKSVREELLSITRKVRVQLAGGPTVPVEGPTKEEVQASRITMEELPVNFFSGEEAKKFYVLGSGQLQAVVSRKKMRVLVDNGSKSTVCRDSIAQEMGLEIDRGVSMSMVVADNKLQPVEGVCHSPVIEVAGVEATVPIFSVKECSSELILGRTWLSAVHATTVDLPEGSQTLSIQSPDGIRVVLKTVDVQDERNRTSVARRKGSQSRVCRVRLEEVPLTDRGPKGDQLEVEDVGDRIVINGMGYEKEDKEEEFGGCVSMSFLEVYP
ncbi:hypothetical protein CBR_g39819 [Chara braunii]|uniref:Uncharacterized protein n=1 Tax=Chara braunii TaxID=69332 RepID=A0A388LSP8_CHABU|nr:hypothetical protein CBR_g39819 [Chara braunii]|eukprot:GBG85253.1 hypothetical protein CBR_g39819 [Chara braunii]